MSMSKRITIIGGGPAGYEAALEGAALGASVTLIENRSIGGTCLNQGCIPTKTWIKHGDVCQTLRQAKDYGVNANLEAFDYQKVVKRQEEVVATLQKGIMASLKKAGVRYLEGYGHLINNKRVSVNYQDGTSEDIEGDIVVLATGSKPFVPSFIPKGVKGIMTSDDLLGLDVLPSSLTIIGGGVIGIEFATVLHDFGVEVTVLEYVDRIIPSLDEALSKRLKSHLSKEGITIEVGAKVIQVLSNQESGDSRLTIEYEKKGKVFALKADNLLVAMSRIAALDLKMLEASGVELKGSFIKVDHNYETSISGVYCIGDANGKNLLAHAAYDQGRQLMNYLLRDQPFVDKMIPACVFTRPEIGVVGLTEAQAIEANLSYRSEKTLFGINGKALAMGETTGMIKSLINDQNQLIGFHVMGPHASDLVHYGVMAMAAKMDLETMSQLVFAHPTLGELFVDHARQYLIKH